MKSALVLQICTQSSRSRMRSGAAWGPPFWRQYVTVCKHTAPQDRQLLMQAFISSVSWGPPTGRKGWSMGRWVST
jgi:hypothetical protein